MSSGRYSRPMDFDGIAGVSRSLFNGFSFIFIAVFLGYLCGAVGEGRGTTQSIVSNPTPLVNPDLSLLVGIVPFRYWKHDGAGAIVEYTAAEKSTQDTVETLAADLGTRQAGKDGLVGFNGRALLQRAFAAVMKDEFNIVRGWTRDFKSAVAAANNLGDLKTAVAALPTLPDRNLGQLRTAMDTRIDGGTIDS